MSNLLRRSPVRVLIVDNEKRTVKLHQELLNLWGYLPVTAEGVGKALLRDAERKARIYRCQIALVDMRLIDDFDEEDTSGLELIKKIKPAETIIVSGYGTLRLGLQSRKSGAVDFFEKNNAPELLKNMLDTIAKKQSFTYRDISISITPTTKNYIEDAPFIADISERYQDQIGDILVRLFPDAEKLRLEKIRAPSNIAYYSTAPRPGSVILHVYKDNNIPVIVKFARTKKIKKEVERFKKYIQGKLEGNNKPSLKKDVTLWDIGGIKLSYVNTIEGSLADFIVSQPIENIEKALSYFFLTVWSKHYKEAKEKSNISLLNLYCSVWGDKWMKRANQFSAPPLPDGFELSQKIHSHDPLSLLKRMMIHEGHSSDPSMIEKTKIAITHGDLHADNLLIDDSQHAWVIDFERTGPGHILQDFVELEADIIIRTTCMQKNFSDSHHFCLAITEVNFNEEITKTNFSFDARTEKTLKIIAKIRKLALRSTGIRDSRQYLLGLYFNTIFRATINTTNSNYSQCKLRTWMLARLLSDKLSAQKHN